MLDITYQPYGNLYNKFFLGEFTESDFQEIYGPSMGTHFWRRYDSGDGIESLFRQFSDGNAAPLLNLLTKERDRPGAFSFQPLVTKSDVNGNPRRAVAVYDARGEICHVIKHSFRPGGDQALREAGYKADFLARLPLIELELPVFNEWIERAEKTDQLKHV